MIENLAWGINQYADVFLSDSNFSTRWLALVDALGACVI
jgi:hypothetical protein